LFVRLVYPPQPFGLTEPPNLGLIYELSLIWVLTLCDALLFFARPYPKAKGHLSGMMFCFYVGWAGFGILFAAGPEGWGPTDTVISEVRLRIVVYPKP
jgi:hypothetical protein